MKRILFFLGFIICLQSCQMNKVEDISQYDIVANLYGELNQELISSFEVIADMDLNNLSDKIYAENRTFLNELLTEIKMNSVGLHVEELSIIQNEKLRTQDYLRILEDKLIFEDDTRRAACTEVTCGVFCNVLNGKNVCQTNAANRFQYLLPYCLSDNNPLGCVFTRIVETIQEFIRVVICTNDVECCEYICL